MEGKSSRKRIRLGDGASTIVQKPREAAMSPAPEEISAPVPSSSGRRRIIRTPRLRPTNSNIGIPRGRRQGQMSHTFKTDILGSSNRRIPVCRLSSLFHAARRNRVSRDIFREIFSDDVPATEITSVTNQHKTVAEQADVSATMVALPQHGTEPLIPEVQPPLTEPMSRAHTSTPLPFNTESKRNGILPTTIRNQLRDNGNMRLNIAQPNRFKMATAFSALLNLEAKQCIVVQSAPGATELDTITPGPRLWDL